MNSGHLTGDEIARAVVDEAALSEYGRAHLTACPSCRAEKDTIAHDLARLREKAQHLAPKPSGRIILAEERDTHPVRYFWGWRTASGMALATLSVIAFIWWYTAAGGPGNGTALVAENGYYTDPEMVEVSLMVENPLPESYLAIAGETTVVEEQ